MNNNIIVINRGDTYFFDVSILDDTSDDGLYTMEGNDAVYFGIMYPHQKFEDAIVRKKFTKDDIEDKNGSCVTILIEPEDTINLTPGKYYYAIKLKTNHYDEYGNLLEGVSTVINKTKFILCD